MLLGSFFQNDDPSQPSMSLETEELEDKEGEDIEPVFRSGDKEQDQDPEQDEKHERHLEDQLKNALEQMKGVTNVSVMVTVSGTETHIFEKNTQSKEQQTEETDREGGTRDVRDSTKDEEVVIIRNGDKEEPLLVQSNKPDIKGVLIVANGVDNIQVKTWVVEAVSRVLDIPSHRVSVMPRKQKEDTT
ncbi:stage III sporulation protein AG [Salipaludibacillus neizhouensis]|uniref:Stage III sporulation protein AG n=2 Tax=Bacillaceae TaxID=186817 RepID=A0A3A9KFN1_9BACI|nr:stage III sporulation protein AG [Salipaludibacillus neizhouensis]